MLRCLFSALIFLFFALSFIHSLYFPLSAFVPLPSLLSLFLSVGSFAFSAVLSSLQKKSAVNQSDDWSALVNVVITGTQQA